MELVCSYLRCQVLWCPTESLHGGAIFDPLLTQTKIRDLYVSIFVQHEVFQLRMKPDVNMTLTRVKHTILERET